MLRFLVFHQSGNRNKDSGRIMTDRADKLILLSFGRIREGRGQSKDVQAFYLECFSSGFLKIVGVGGFIVFSLAQLKFVWG